MSDQTMTPLPMTPAMRRIKTAALWLLGGIVFAADVTAFAESYNGLNTWARGHRVTAGWAVPWPLQVDAFILAGEIVLLLAAIYGWGQRPRVLGWLMAGGGLAASIVWNAGHVGADATGADHLTAAVPPVAAMAGLMAALSVIKHLAVTTPAPNSTTRARTDGSVTLTPATPAARAAVLAAMTHDLTAAVADVTTALARIVGDTPQGHLTPLDPPAIEAGDTVTPPADDPGTPRPDDDPPGGGQRPRTAPRVLPSPRVPAGALAGLPSDAARVRAALDALGIDSTPAAVGQWLDQHGAAVKEGTIKTAIRRARAAARSESAPAAPVVSLVRDA